MERQPYYNEFRVKSEKTAKYLALALIIIAGFAVYSNSLHGKFIWDDEYLIQYNAYIKNNSHISEILTKDIGAGAAKKLPAYRPLQILTYMLDYSLWDLNVLGYHITNTLLHILVALVFYWLCNTLYNHRLLSLFASVFFVVHPVHTEAISYISGRADPLSALLMLLCLIFYIKLLDSKNLFSFILMLLSYILAILSKENALILPILLLLYHYTFKKRLEPKLFLPILGITLVYLLLRVTLLRHLFSYAVYSNTLFQRLPGVFVAITNYLRLLFLPVNLHMEYGRQLVSFIEPKALFGLAVSILLLLYAFRKRESKKLLFFSVCWFFINLLPVSNLYPINAYMAEHWLYLPSLGFFMILASSLVSLHKARNLRVLTISCVISLIAFYSYLTIRQNEVWKEPILFYKRILKYAPHSQRVYNNLGNAYADTGRYREAIATYKKALEIDPNDADTYNNLGTVYTDMDRYEEATALYKIALDIDKNHAEAYNNLGLVYSYTGNYDRAIEMFGKAIEINTYYAQAYYNLGVAFNNLGRRKQAIASFKKAIKIEPANALAHNNLAITYYYEKQRDLAIRHFKRAARLGYKVEPEFLNLLQSQR